MPQEFTRNKCIQFSKKKSKNKNLWTTKVKVSRLLLIKGDVSIIANSENDDASESSNTDTVRELVGFLLGCLLTAGDPVGIELGLFDIVGASLGLLLGMTPPFGEIVGTMLGIDNTVGNRVGLEKGFFDIVEAPLGL